MKTIKLSTLIFAMITLTTSCKKEIKSTTTTGNQVAKQFQEKVENALLNSGKFSSIEIDKLKSATVTIENKFRGFNSSASLLDRFTPTERQDFYEKITGESLTSFDKDEHIIIQSRTIKPQSNKVMQEHKDKAPIGRNDCYSSYDATCVTY